MTKAVRIMGLAAAMSGLVLAGGCVPLKSHQGYIIDADLVNSVQPGVDNRASVLQTLGKPTIASQFNEGEWYYVARDSRNLAFRLPRAQSQVALKLTFNQAGVVQSITRTGMDQITFVTPYGKTTPTLGRQRGFFEDLFGNIGSVGAAGGGGPGGPGGPGGDDSRP